MLPILQKLGQYKWTVLAALMMFVFCLLIINFGFWIAVVVLFFTILAALVGYIFDAQIDVKRFFNNK